MRTHVCYGCFYPARPTPANPPVSRLCAICGHIAEGQQRSVQKGRWGILRVVPDDHHLTTPPSEGIASDKHLRLNMTDNTGKTCIRCGEGTYRIADLNDEIHGERHCDKCGHFVRYDQDLTLSSSGGD